MNKKEEILLKFKQRISEGKSIKYKEFKSEDSSLLFAIEKHFGGIFKIATAIGITEEELIEKHGLTRSINKRTLSEEEIRYRLLYLKSIGKLTTNAMRNEFNDLRLERSIKKLYGSVENGLKYFNLERDRVIVSKDAIIREIHTLANKNADMSYNAILNTNPKLLYNANRHFNKGWYGVLDELNIKYSAKRQRFTHENILKRINLLLEQFGEINSPIIKENDSSILFYAYDNYESLEDFYVDMGLNPAKCMDYSKQTMKGFAFEKVFKQVLDLLGLDYKYNKHFNKTLRPDFQLNNGIWIDCKLSSWTNSIEETIEKYTPNCNKLIIVFLRGHEKHLKQYENDKVEFRKIDYYYPFLNQINRQDLIEVFNNIINDEFLESVTTKRLIS